MPRLVTPYERSLVAMKRYKCLKIFVFLKHVVHAGAAVKLPDGEGLVDEIECLGIG